MTDIGMRYDADATTEQDTTSAVGTEKPALLLGLIGYGIRGSLTPAMHQREADEQGLRCIYRLIDLQRLGFGVEGLADLLTAAERMGFNGLNITVPPSRR
jgi:shikimate dehydrogenase